VRPDLDIAIVSVFCGGGLFAYVREALRLRRLISAGKTAVARIIDTKEDDSGSESVVHYLVKYEFVDEEGHQIVHDKDLISKRFFDTLKRGDTIRVLYEAPPDGNSYPVSQVRSDMRISGLIAAVIFIFWVVMVAFFTLK